MCYNLTRSEGGEKPRTQLLPLSHRKPRAQLTCDPTAKELQAQGDAQVPRLRADPDEPRQQRHVELVYNHLSCIAVSLKYLQRKMQSGVTVDGANTRAGFERGREAPHACPDITSG